MCTFHQQRQAGILLERQGGKRASYVLFTHHSRQTGILFEREDGTGGVRFTANNFIRAGREKHKSFKALIVKSSESLGKWYLWDWCQETR